MTRLPNVISPQLSHVAVRVHLKNDENPMTRLSNAKDEEDYELVFEHRNVPNKPLKGRDNIRAEGRIAQYPHHSDLTDTVR